MLESVSFKKLGTMKAEIVDFDITAFKQSVKRNAPTELVRNAIFELLEFSVNSADRIKGGEARTGSFHYQVKRNAKALTVFTCDSSDYISVSLGNFHGLRVTVFSSTLAKLPGFDNFLKDYW